MHINSQTGISVVQISRSCLARYLDAADHIVAAGAGSEIDGRQDDSGFYVAAEAR